MAEIKKIIEGLHPLERKVLPVLAKLSSLSSFKEIISKTGLKDVEVMRALQWLENKGILKIKKEAKEIIVLDKNGEEYSKSGLPEKRVLQALNKGNLDMDEIVSKAKIKQEEFGVSIGTLKKKAAIFLDGKTVKISEPGRKLLEKESFEEKLIERLSKGGIEANSLNDEERFAFENLKKRKQIIKTSPLKIVNAGLTELGKKAAKENISGIKTSDRLTPAMLKTGAWKGKKFRRYDVKINVPKISIGKKQHYRAFLDWVRKKFMAIGFKEMTGPVVESEFWDMDALFMPQFHSARDIHDAYYIKEPKYANISADLIKKVKAAHENGGGTGSKGWQYEFDSQRTKRQVLRTQGTACSARMLASKDLEIPGKYFGITRCFRYDVVDATHNVDFYQTEGIVVEENINFQHLKGLLKMFAEEFAQTDQIKIKPAYFPFTEPSAELFAKHPELGWIELGGSGVFRPEVVKPLLGIEVPVLAWGLGIDRIGMLNMGINDIRKLFSHDLEFLRGIKSKY